MDPEKTVPEEEIFSAGAAETPEVEEEDEEAEEEDEELESAEHDDPPGSGVGQPVELEEERR